MNIIKKIYPSALIKRKPPLNLQQGDDIYFGGPKYECLIPESNLCKFTDVLVTYNGVILDNFIPQKEFIICYENDFKKYWLKYVLSTIIRNKKKKLKKSKNYLLIFDNYSGPQGFAHWISDGLTRLVELDYQLSDYTILIPQYFNEEPLYGQILSCFNLKEVEVIPKDHYVKIKNLFVSNHIARTGDYLPHNVIKLRKHFWEKLEINNKKGFGEKIYISRKKASRRFVTNENLVEEFLKQYGFIAICMEDYTFKQQVEIAYHSKHLISIHGGALTNILFMQSGSTVLEFRKEFDGENCLYYSLADALSVNYFYQFCKADNKSQTGNNFDLTVNLNELQINLELMLKNI